MKKPHLRDLQGQLLGHVTDAPEVLESFAADAGIYNARPEAVVYPKNTADVRRSVLLALERQAAGKPLPVTARGNGTDLTGGAVGEGLAVVFPASMNKVLDMDRRTVTVQPGANFWTVQQLLHAQARFLPSYPASQHYSTIGGAVAGNAAGVKSVKYGSMRDYVRRLKVVLADGSLVTFGRITPRQLQRKKGQTDLEGEIYRRVDALVTDHRRLISQAMPRTVLNNAGYALDRLKGPDGSLDIAQLLVGSQGTLGLITEIVLETAAWSPRTCLVAGYFDNLDTAVEAVVKLRELGPSALEMVDGAAIEFIRRHRADDLEGLVPESTPRLVLLAEFDDGSQLAQLRKIRRAQRLFTRLATAQRYCDNALEQEALWRICATAGSLWLAAGSAGLPPVLADAAVPVSKFGQLLTLAERLAAKYEITLLVHGHAGVGQVWAQPVMELGRKKADEFLPRLADDYYEAVLSLGGTVSAAHGDGIGKGRYLERQYGAEVYELMRQVKQIFDPNGIFNPLTKFSPAGAAQDLVRPSYHLPPGVEIYP